MENATKALLIVAGVLIGIMILSLGTALFLELEIYVESSHEKMEFNELNAFNTQFTKYIGTDLTIQDIVSAANLAHENNVQYNIIKSEDINESRGNQSSTYVTIYLDTTPIEEDINSKSSELLKNNLGKIFECDEALYSEKTGRIYKIIFSEK